MKKNNKDKVITVACEYSVEGMNCASCELNIEKRLKEKLKNLESVDAKLTDGKVNMRFRTNLPAIEEINLALKGTNYKVIEETPVLEHSVGIKNGKLSFNPQRLKNQLTLLLVAIGIMLLISGVYDLVRENSKNFTDTASLIGKEIEINYLTVSTFFVTGLIAGFSGCAALVGGLLISLRNQLNSFASGKELSTYQKLIPYIQFNLGRIVSFTLLGGLLGLLGGLVTINISFNALLVIVVSLAMVALGAQMAGWSYFQKFKVSLPKRFLHRISSTENSNGTKAVPFALGFLTFFLPCGVTLLSQSIAITTGSFITSAILMGVFALGTLPPLILISFFNIYSDRSRHISELIIKVSGIIVVTFSLYTLNNQLKTFAIPTVDTLSSVGHVIEFILFYLIVILLGVNAFTLAKLSAKSKGQKSKVYSLLVLILVSVIIIVIYNYPMIRSLIF